MRNVCRLAVSVAFAGAVTLASAGCEPGSPEGSPTPGPGTPTDGRPSATATANATASPTLSPPPTDPAIVIAADGIGPYVIGAMLSDLQGRALVAGVVQSQLCADSKAANATGRYSGQLTFTFSRDRLVAIHTTST